MTYKRFSESRNYRHRETFVAHAALSATRRYTFAATSSSSLLLAVFLSHSRRSWCPACPLNAELLHHRLHFKLSSRLSGKPLYRRLGVSKDVVYVYTHHRLHLSIIKLIEYAGIRFWLLEPVVVEYAEQAPSRLYAPVNNPMPPETLDIPREP